MAKLTPMELKIKFEINGVPYGIAMEYPTEEEHQDKALKWLQRSINMTLKSIK